MQIAGNEEAGLRIGLAGGLDLLNNPKSHRDNPSIVEHGGIQGVYFNV